MRKQHPRVGTAAVAAGTMRPAPGLPQLQLAATPVMPERTRAQRLLQAAMEWHRRDMPVRQGGASGCTNHRAAGVRSASAT